jgi:hypothetical protein
MLSREVLQARVGGMPGMVPATSKTERERERAGSPKKDDSYLTEPEE